MLLDKKNILVLILGIVFLASCTKKTQLPIVDFTFEDYQEGPVEIQFTNNTKFADKYIWEFGDGNYSNLDNPVNNYKFPGEYTVKLKAYNEEGYNYIEKIINISGTSFLIKNVSTESIIYNVFSFYEDIDSIYFYSFGNIMPGEESAQVYTKLREINVGFQIGDGKFFVIYPPYNIQPDKKNILKIHENLTGYILE